MRLHKGQEYQATILVQNGEPLLGTDVLSKLGCSVMVLQDGGKVTDLFQREEWCKCQGTSTKSHLRAEAPSFIPATVGHIELKTVEPSTSQLRAKGVSTEKSVVPSTSQLCTESDVTENSVVSSTSQLCAESLFTDNSMSQMCVENNIVI